MSESSDTLSLPKNYKSEGITNSSKPVRHYLTGTTLQAVTITIQPGQKIHSQIGCVFDR